MSETTPETTSRTISDYQVIVRTPTLNEYRQICVAVGWGTSIPFEVAEKALQQSLYNVVITHEYQAVGMGRVVGDGAIYFYVQDIAVVPEHQGHGVGKLIMDTLMTYIRANATPQSFVALFATPNTPPFYEQFGFNEYDYMPAMVVRLPLHDV